MQAQGLGQSSSVGGRIEQAAWVYPAYVGPHVPHATIVSIPYRNGSDMEAVMQSVMTRQAEDRDVLFPVTEATPDLHAQRSHDDSIEGVPGLSQAPLKDPTGTANATGTLPASADSISRIQRMLNRQATADYLVWGFSMNYLM